LDLLVLVFPMLILVAALGIISRLARSLLLRLRRSTHGRRSAAWFLALRRLAGAPHVALVMLSAAALPIGLLIYASAVTGSLGATIHAKTETFVGADVAATF